MPPDAIRRKAFAAIGALGLLVACSDAGPGNGPDPNPNPSLVRCGATSDALFDGGPGRDGIPSLTNPPLVPIDNIEARYVFDYTQKKESFEPDPRIVGLLLDGVEVAIPYNILWWHEIVNVDVGGRRIAITYCPLTASPLAFDVTASGMERLGVSGLILQNNLVMFDPETESLWPQLCTRAVAGPRDGENLTMVPIVDMLWTQWKERHPNSLVPSGSTGFNRPYDEYPYGGYETSRFLLFPQGEIDARRPMKERVLGLPDGQGGEAFPFGEFQGAARLAVSTRRGGASITVLWDQDALTAAAFFPRTADGTTVTLRSAGTGFIDAETGSTWDVEGRALEGPLAGTRLIGVPDATVAFWFAWAAFHPETRVWSRE